MPTSKRNTDDDVRQYIEVVKKDVDKRLTDLKAELDDVQSKAAKLVKEEPLLALGMAFILGIAVGIAIANAGD